MDPAEADERSREELGAEMRPVLDAIEAAAVFAAQHAWPLSDRLPVKRQVGEHGHEVGMLIADGRPVVENADGIPIAYMTFEDMARDGWRPD
jgi:hypothetical protein